MKITRINPGEQMVWRCQYTGLDPAGCSWSTTQYSEIDAHEDQIDPGHLVSGEMERIDKYHIVLNGQTVLASEEQQDRIAAMTPEQQEYFLAILGKQQT